MPEVAMDVKGLCEPVAWQWLCKSVLGYPDRWVLCEGAECAASKTEAGIEVRALVPATALSTLSRELVEARAERDEARREVGAADADRSCARAGLYVATKRLETAESACRALREELADEAQAHLKTMARAESAEEMLKRLLSAAVSLAGQAEGCIVNHYSEDHAIHGLPGWYLDCVADIAVARARSTKEPT